MATIFQNIYTQADYLLNTFLKNNPTISARGVELRFSRAITDFLYGNFLLLRSNYDLFELKNMLIAFRDGLLVPENSGPRPKEFSNSLTDFINLMDPFALYCSAFEERLERYICKDEGKNNRYRYPVVAMIRRDLEWLYADMYKEEVPIVKLKSAMTNWMQELAGSNNLLPSLRELAAELPEQNYVAITKVEKSNSEAVGATFSNYYNKIQALLDEALKKEVDWKAEIEAAKKELEGYNPALNPDDKKNFNITALLAFKKRVQTIINEKLIGQYSYSVPQVKSDIEKTLAEIPSERYEKHTAKLEYKFSACDQQMDLGESSGASELVVPVQEMHLSEEKTMPTPPAVSAEDDLRHVVSGLQKRLDEAEAKLRKHDEEDAKRNEPMEVDVGETSKAVLFSREALPAAATPSLVVLPPGVVGREGESAAEAYRRQAGAGLN